MKLNKGLLFAISLLAFGAQSAVAEEAATPAAPGGSSFQSMADSAKMHFEYNFKLLYNDNAVKKVEGADAPNKTTTLMGSAFKLKTDLKARDNVDFKFDFNFLGTSTTYEALESAEVSIWFMPAFGVTLGKSKTHVGGWENYYNTTYKVFASKYSANKPFDTYAPAATIQYKTMGVVSLQLLNDNTGSERSWSQLDKNKDEQLAMVLEWKGDLGAVKPLIAYASYDDSHSKYLSLGVLYNEGPVSAYFDFIQDQKAWSDSSDNNKEKIDTVSSINLQANYDLGDFEPFFKFSSFNVKDADTDVKVNTFVPAAEATATTDATPTTYAWDDNATQYAIGTYFLKQGGFARPYAALSIESGKFAKADGSEETKSNTMMLIGIDGAI